MRCWRSSAVFGGEGNGGPIDPRVGLVRDSFVGMALVLDVMAARGKKISELADELPRYEIRKTTIKLPPEKLPAALEAMRIAISRCSGRPLRRPATGLARPLADCAGEQHRADCAGHRGSTDRGRCRGALPGCGGGCSEGIGPDRAGCAAYAVEGRSRR